MDAWMIPAAYLLGGVPFGVFLGRRRGVDVMNAGSRNIGATNVWRLCGPKAGALCLALDVAKGLLPTVAARALAPEAAVLHVLVAAAAVLGHTFSPYLRFRGGKAVGTSLGCCLALAPLAAGVGFALFVLVVALTRYVSLGSLLGTLAAAIVSWAAGDPPAYALVISGGVALIWIRHTANIGRLLRGEEHRFGTPRPAEPAEPPE